MGCTFRLLSRQQLVTAAALLIRALMQYVREAGIRRNVQLQLAMGLLPLTTGCRAYTLYCKFQRSDRSWNSIFISSVHQISATPGRSVKIFGFVRFC
jgi:hypothetical protein